jgi:hypothetical protein
MVSLQTKNPNLGKLWRALDWKILIYFMAIWNILQTFGIFYGHLVHFAVIWYFFPVLVCCTEKNLATLRCMFKFQGQVTLFATFHARASVFLQILEISILRILVAEQNLIGKKIVTSEESLRNRETNATPIFFIA